jgi:hypothetical protein
VEVVVAVTRHIQPCASLRHHPTSIVTTFDTRTSGSARPTRITSTAIAMAGAASSSDTNRHLRLLGLLGVIAIVANSCGAAPPTAGPILEPPPGTNSSCDYDPCLPPASDYDCLGGSGDGPEYTGRVTVTGSDPYGLDADGDGVGCE